VTAPVDLLQR